MKEKNWRSIYKPEFPKVKEMCNYLQKQMMEQIPEVLKAFEACQVIKHLRIYLLF